MVLWIYGSEFATKKKNAVLHLHMHCDTLYTRHLYVSEIYQFSYIKKKKNLITCFRCSEKGFGNF